MTTSLELSPRREAKLLQEFRDAIAATSRRELCSWGARSANVLSAVTVRRVSNIASLATNVWGFITTGTRGLLDALRRKETLPHLRSKSAAATKSVQALGRDFATVYNTLVRNLRDHPGDTAPRMVAGVLGFLVGSGGVDGDGGVPDLDLLGGMIDLYAFGDRGNSR